MAEAAELRRNRWLAPVVVASVCGGALAFVAGHLIRGAGG